MQLIPLARAQVAALLVASVAGFASSAETACFQGCESPKPIPLVAVFAVFPEIPCERIFSSSPLKKWKSVMAPLTTRFANFPKYAHPSSTPITGSRLVLVLTSIWFNL